MEHRIVLGGVEYLPFARSRIKALRAAGLEHASQRFEINGVFVEVRIVGEHSFIRLFGADGGSIPMDSGLIDVGAYSELAPARYDPRPLRWAGSAIAYNASFAPTDPVSGFLKNPAEASAGQLSGVLSQRRNALRGALAYDNTDARACSPGTVPDVSTTPAGWKPNPTDGLLVYKKTLMALCPASIFTGRCRLYVQALYGVPLYADDKRNREGDIIEGGRANYLPELIAPAGTSAPYLKIAPRREPDDAEYSSVPITTSSGVFLDPATGKHWLLNASAEALDIYPLIGTKHAESLRGRLRSGSAVFGQLGEEDREHLEAYILSTCRPHAAKVRTYPFSAGASISNYSMGYGWHWNWDGLKADIVNSVSFWQQRVVVTDYYGMRSTHFRLSVAPTQVAATPAVPATTNFEVSASVVEGPTDWTVERVLWCIVEPNWGAGHLTKVTEPFTAMLDAFDAPFYAFYVRNELKVCRVAGTKTTTYSERTNSDPIFDSGGFGMLTAGLLGGWGETTSFTGKYYSVTFSCGGESVGPLHAYRTESGDRDEISSKVKYGQQPGTLADSAYATPFSIETGYPPYTLVWFPENYRTELSALRVRYTHTRSAVNQSWSSEMVVVIPHKDSQAVYMQGKSTHNRTLTAPYERMIDSPQFGTETRARYQPGGQVSDIGPWSPYYPRYVYGFGSGGDNSFIVGDTLVDPVETSSVLVDKSFLVCQAGTIPADLTNDIFLARFHDNQYEDIPSNFNTVSGASKINPVVISKLYTDPVGTDVEPDIPALVGWV